MVIVASYFLWPTAAAQPDPQKLANQLAGGKTISLPGGGTFQATSPAAGYFALSAGPQRLAYLDRMIDEQEATRKRIASGEIQLPPGAHPATGPSNQSDEMRGVKTSIEHNTSTDGTRKSVTIRLNSDDLSPDFRAQMEEFSAALRKRRKERGLDPDAPMMIIRTETRNAK